MVFCNSHSAFSRSSKLPCFTSSWPPWCPPLQRRPVFLLFFLLVLDLARTPPPSPVYVSSVTAFMPSAELCVCVCGKGGEGKRSEVTDSATATAAAGAAGTAGAAGAAATVITSKAAAAGASLYSCYYKRYCSATVIATSTATTRTCTVSNNRTHWYY